MRIWLLATLLLGSCRFDPVDARMPDTDAGAADWAQSCLARPPLELGTCAGADAPCAASRFVPLVEGQTVTWTVGPSGPELALAVRATGMAPGQTALAELVITTGGGEQVAGALASVRFAGDPVATDAVVVRMDRGLAGQMLRATVAFADGQQERRCGSVHFTVQP